MLIERSRAKQGYLRCRGLCPTLRTPLYLEVGPCPNVFLASLSSGAPAASRPVKKPAVSNSVAFAGNLVADASAG